jgi:hypothetical protein
MAFGFDVIELCHGNLFVTPHLKILRGNQVKLLDVIVLSGIPRLFAGMPLAPDLTHDGTIYIFALIFTVSFCELRFHGRAVLFPASIQMTL